VNDAILEKYNNVKRRKLKLAVIIDMVGILSFLIPGIGEWADLIWAPISGYMIYLLFPNRKKMAFIGALEEAIPFLDVIPTAYLTWRQEYVKDKDKTLSKFVANELREQEIMNEALNKNDDYERLD